MALQRIKLIELEEDGKSTITEHSSFAELRKYAAKKIGKVEVIAPVVKEDNDYEKTLTSQDSLDKEEPADTEASKTTNNTNNTNEVPEDNGSSEPAESDN